MFQDPAIDDLLIPDQQDQVVAIEQGRGLPAALEDCLGRIVAAHDVNGGSHLNSFQSRAGR